MGRSSISRKVHPQRTMLLAHLLWEATQPGAEATELGWHAAIATALSYVGYELEARWSALTANERRVLRGLVEHGNLGAGALAALALPKGSVDGTIRRLLAVGELERDGGALRLVDPLFQRWMEGLDAASAMRARNQASASASMSTSS